MINILAKGFSLIEIIITIVILSISTTAILGAYNTIVRGSADPMLIQQSVSIAQAYMEEITLLNYDDPNDGGASSGTGSEGTEGADRTLFDDVDDYNSLTETAIEDTQGNPVTSLSNFSVAVVVAAESTLNNATVKKITVTISHPAISDFQLIGFKSYYDDSKTY